MKFVTGAAVLLGWAMPVSAAQTDNWVPFSYSDLQSLSLAQPVFREMWKDKISDNNELYRQKHDPRFLFGNAPVTEAHFFVEAKSQGRLLLVSLINAAQSCALLQRDSVNGTTLKRCPVRILMQDHETHSLHDAGEACLVEYGVAAQTTPADVGTNAMYGRYDHASNRLHMDAKFEGALQDRCAVSFSLPPWPESP